MSSSTIKPAPQSPGCACCVIYYYSSNFYANIRGVDMADMLVGVLRLKTNTVEASYLKLLESPEETVES